MLDIIKLANLTGLHLNPDEQSLLQTQLESVVSLLDKIKEYDLPTPTTTWHDLLGLQSIPVQDGLPDSDPDQILHNVAHPVVGHSVEVRAFVE